MNLLASIVIAGAVQFCAETPYDPLCAPREITPVEMTLDRRRTINAIAADGLHGYRAEGRGNDDWNPDARRRDCDDQVLWIMRELARRDPRLYAAAQPVVILRERGEGHLVVVLATTHEPIVFDRIENGRELSGVVQPWNNRWRAFAPQGGIGGRWVAYHR